MKLMPMTMGHALQMLKWKNYPETRKFAIVSHKIISKSNHCKWLRGNLQYFQVILEKGKVCGAIRVQDKEVSIWIDRTFWDQGIAQKTIKKVSKKGFTAKIVEGHIVSMRCFINCGYLPVSYQGGYYIFQCTI